VNYSSYLFRVARQDAWTWAVRRKGRTAADGLGVFFLFALFSWMMRGAEAEFLAPIVWGFVGIVLGGLGVFAAHFFYLTPRKLCAAKQGQLDSERRRFEALLEGERQAAKVMAAGREVPKSPAEGPPMRPPEVRQEIDQLISEGEVLLGAEESAMIHEAELWLDDVERFARRHLSSDQYDQVHAAAPADLEEQVQLYRSQSDDSPVPEEELAAAAQVVRISAGLREVREQLAG
jgi:hypothetical protein